MTKAECRSSRNCVLWKVPTTVNINKIAGKISVLPTSSSSMGMTELAPGSCMEHHCRLTYTAVVMEAYFTFEISRRPPIFSISWRSRRKRATYGWRGQGGSFARIGLSTRLPATQTITFIWYGAVENLGLRRQDFH
ncbi:hypothetical protein [Bacteroides acidifaciens]|uniref:hypothetical protein n=1 Tax=Bacteroides acidifaciens TaxID=85831 RepID=UPI003F68D0A1